MYCKYNLTTSRPNRMFLPPLKFAIAMNNAPHYADNDASPSTLYTFAHTEIRLAQIRKWNMLYKSCAVWNVIHSIRSILDWLCFCYAIHVENECYHYQLNVNLATPAKCIAYPWHNPMVAACVVEICVFYEYSVLWCGVGANGWNVTYRIQCVNPNTRSTQHF